MWLRRINSERLCEDVFGPSFNSDIEHRYELYDAHAQTIQIGDKYTTVYSIRQFWKNNDGEWKPCAGDGILVTLETLLSNYMLIDSRIEKGVKSLVDYKLQKEEENLKQLDKFIVRDTETVTTTVTGEPTCTNMDVSDY